MLLLTGGDLSVMIVGNFGRTWRLERQIYGKHASLCPIGGV